MNEREYMIALGKIPGSRKNQIIMAVNAKIQKEKAGLKSPVEEMFFERLMAEAKTHKKKHGFWPVFEMSEIESEDPALDIYRGPAEKRSK